MSEEYMLIGVIVDPGKYVPNSERKIVIQTSKGNKYKCIVPTKIFANFQEDDTIECHVIKKEENEKSSNEKKDTTYIMTRTPFIQLSVDRDNIERCFMRALKGTGFGAKSAEILYNNLKKMASDLGYSTFVKKSIPFLQIEESNKNNEEEESNKNNEEEESNKNNEEEESNKNNEEEESNKNNEKEKNNNNNEEKSNKKERLKGLPFSTKEEILIPQIVGYDGVISYLSELSNNFHDSGDKNSVSILNACGTREKQAEKLLIWWYKSRSLRRLHLLGLSDKMIADCKKDLDFIYQTILINPFKLAPLSIEKCIELMSTLNKEVTDSHIKCGEILRKIYSYVNEMSYSCVLFTTVEYHFPKIFQYLQELIKDYGVILDGRHLYLEYNYRVENSVAILVDSLIKETAQIICLPKTDGPILQTAKYTIKTLTEEQKMAITGALHSKICAINGAAGSGKTSCCKEIYNNFELRGIKMVACAFTGKAVSRLNKSLGKRIAKTMDFMIARSSSIDPFDVVLIDECSMVTTELIYRFKKAFNFNFSIILVGDCNQLPPISWGFFMKQIIISERVPIYTLTKNQRIIKHTMTSDEEIDLEKKSKNKDPASVEFDRTILLNCEELIDPNRNLDEPMVFEEGNGFFTLNGDLNTIESILRQLSTYYPLQDITCISPYNINVKPINEMFQKIFLGSVKTVVDRKGRTWKVGDRVMMLQNNYVIDIMNGEEGLIVSLTDKGVKVKFDDGVEHEFLYVSANSDNYEDNDSIEKNNWVADELICDMIQQSFCITVHKSQGSEYRIVLIYIPENRNKKGKLSSFLNINLLYTAITRTKQAVWIISPEGVLGDISMNKLATRVDNLAGRLIKMKDLELEKTLADTTKIKFERQFQKEKKKVNSDDDDDNASYYDDLPLDIDDD